MSQKNGRKLQLPQTQVAFQVYCCVVSGAKVVPLVSAQPSVRGVPSSIPSDITSLFQLLSFLSSLGQL